MSETIILRGEAGKADMTRSVLASIDGLRGKYISVEIKEVREPSVNKKRSDAQNRYMWGVPIQMIRARLLEQDMPQETKDSLTPLMVQRIVKLAVGISHRVPLFSATPVIIEGRTRTMTTVQFMDTMTQIQEWAARVLNIYIPDPKELGWDEWAEEQMNIEQSKQRKD